ncbi:MAG: hypothetical protein IT184_10635 [Acidobacteria bacterium]|nr:hypothetical protein [Acidobacteriota bacterium]
MTPVHDQSYRRYGGTRLPLGRAWTVIARTGMRAVLSRRVFIGLLALAWLPFLVRTIQIYAVVTYPQAAQVLPVDRRLFQRFIEGQDVFVFFITVFVGAGLIARDKQANALQVYLARPLLRAEYVAGKLAIVVSYLVATTMIPAVMLVLMQAVLSGNLEFVRANPGLLPAVVVATSVQVLVWSVTILALSSASRSTRFVAMAYAGVVFLSQALYVLLRAITGSTRVAWVSLPRNFDVINDAIFRQPARYDTPVLVSVIVLAGLVVLSLSVLDRQVRGVEVVS